MSAPLSKKATARFQSNTDIEALQGQLLRSLSTAFDPTAALRSDNDLLGQDHSLTNCNESSADPFAKKPYQALAERARTYVEKAAAEKPVGTKVKCNTNKKSNTFVTYVEVEGNIGNKWTDLPKEEPLEQYTPLAPITYDNILLGVTTKTEKEDDLAELRRMIKKTRRDMNSYGKELMSLKDDVIGVNDYASKELGYEANNRLMYSVESSGNLFKRGSGFKSENNEKVNSRNLKRDENTKLSKTSSTNTVLNNSGAVKKGFGTASGKGTLRKW